MDAESENSGATIIPFPGAKGTGREHPAARPLRDLTWGDVDELLATTARSRSSSPSGGHARVQRHRQAAATEDAALRRARAERAGARHGSPHPGRIA
ncbi:hypothetical protein [Streptomyces roseoverticillatus]|uniref:Uncharacterized protein n=1 Tax=Streptomyces roseoverticillatus TaxID=66429 RepID=A0ABV3IR49_9ACTN